MSIPLKADLYAEMSFVMDTRALASARRFLGRTLSDVPEWALAEITMAVDEAMANVIEHACPPPGSTLELRLYRDGDHVRLLMRHEGVPFDGGIADPDLDRHCAERRTSGLGVFLMRRLMDLVHFRQTPGGLQELVMVKHLQDAA